MLTTVRDNHNLIPRWFQFHESPCHGQCKILEHEHGKKRSRKARKIWSRHPWWLERKVGTLVPAKIFRACCGIGGITETLFWAEVLMSWLGTFYTRSKQLTSSTSQQAVSEIPLWHKQAVNIIVDGGKILCIYLGFRSNWKYRK